MSTRALFLALLLIATISPASRAQRVSQLGVGVAPPNLAVTIVGDPGVIRSPDSTASQAPRAMPFVLAGAGIGAVMGAMLAAAYNPCSGDPQPGFSCTSTDPATGAFIGIVVGSAVGLAVWAVVKSARAARAAGKG